MMNNLIKIGDFDKIMSDRNVFNKIVYTPMSEALRLLEERRNDPVLMAKVEKLLKGNIPDILKNKKCGVLCRQIATPNHESRMFVTLLKENNLYPVFFEYLEDKFTSNNSYKHSLGQLHIQKKTDKKGNSNVERITIVDFNKYSGKKLREVKTLWNEPLVDFHRKLFIAHGYNKEDFNFHDVSLWFKNTGGKAVNYYENFLILFTCYGILFENFLMLKGEEGEFTKDIVLPAIEKVINTIGVKPLIVPLEPLDMEADSFWFHHLTKVKKYIQ